MVGPTSPAAAAAVERRIVSILFADIVGWTPLSERLDPEDVATVQDAYFGAVRDTIGRYGGVLEKFIGDAAMAVFGVPIARDDDAERAVRAGLALLGAIEQLGARLGLDPGDVQLRVGVTTGEVVHATDGPDAGRVTGDTVNTAARLQAAARPGSVLIGELTALTVAETIETAPHEPVDLKGKADPVRCAEAIEPRVQPSRERALGDLRAPMLGRSAELARLNEAFERVVTGASAHRLVVVAPPGVGKSRLLHELAASITSGSHVLRARVRPQATAPYETVAQLFGAQDMADLDARLAEAGVPATRAAVIAAEVAILEGTPDAGRTGSGDLAAERDARFDAWITALDALADQVATWLVEDVHWAGADLLAFLDRAGRAPSRHGRLLVTTARPSLLETAPEWCRSDRLELGPLPPTDASALVTALVGSELPAPLVAAIVKRSDGTPLFIEELLRTWASVGTLVHEGDRWRLALEPDAVSLPATVQAIYAAQLDDLPPAARLVARRGAVAGRRVPIDALGALGVVGDDGLEVLRRRTLVAGPVRDPITGDAYFYRHALLRDAGYASLARAERARLHVAMARWLAEVAGDRADLVAEGVAEHYAFARDNLPAIVRDELDSPSALAAEAATWYERAAESALRLAAHEAAIRLFERSIEMTEGLLGPDSSRRRRRLGEVLSASADLDAGIAQLREALAAAGDDAASVAATAYALARAQMQQIGFADAEALTADAIERLAAEPSVLRARLHALHAWAVAAQGRRDGVLEEAALARDLARDSDDGRLELDVLDHTNAARDEVDAATAGDWDELAERALAVGDWHHAVVGARASAVYRSAEAPREAIAAMAATAELARAHGLLEQAGWSDYARCELLWVIGDWDAAMAVGVDVVDLAERNAYGRLAFRTLVVLLPMAAARRDPATAARYAAWWDASMERLPADPSPYARYLWAAARVWMAQAREEPLPVPAEDLPPVFVAMSNAHHVAAVEALVESWLAAGRTDLAASLADRVSESAAAKDASALMRASSQLIGAWLGRVEAAAAVAAARAADAPWWEARALRAAGAEAEAAAIERRLGGSPDANPHAGDPGQAPDIQSPWR